MNKTYYTKTYYTRIKNDDPTIGGGNKYVQGVIMGIMLSVCRECVEDDFLTFIANGTIRVLKDKQNGDHIYTIHTTDELYEKFKGIVNKEYPNVCEFDIYD